MIARIDVLVHVTMLYDVSEFYSRYLYGGLQEYEGCDVPRFGFLFLKIPQKSLLFLLHYCSAFTTRARKAIGIWRKLGRTRSGLIFETT